MSTARARLRNELYAGFGTSLLAPLLLPFPLTAWYALQWIPELGVELGAARALIAFWALQAVGNGLTGMAAWLVFAPVYLLVGRVNDGMWDRAELGRVAMVGGIGGVAGLLLVDALALPEYPIWIGWLYGGTSGALFCLGAMTARAGPPRGPITERVRAPQERDEAIMLG